VHELCGPSRQMLAARIMARSQGPVVWIRPGWTPERLNAAGLQPLADPSRLILVQARAMTASSGPRKRRSAPAPSPSSWPSFSRPPP
jgi:hypothetical protein